jgi:hypothetical protein
LKAHVKGGTIKEFAPWNVENLRHLTYYVAGKLANGQITGASVDRSASPTTP